MERGDINQSSFAFQVDYENNGDNWEYDETNDIYIRTLLKCKSLYDVSPVTYPAYEQTESIVSQRSMDTFKQLKSEKRLNYLLDLKKKRLNLAEKLF